MVYYYYYIVERPDHGYNQFLHYGFTKTLKNKPLVIGIYRWFYHTAKVTVTITMTVI